MVQPKSLQFMANDFWQPTPENIFLRIFPGGSYQKTSINRWQLKLISEKKPVFNYPIEEPKAA